MIITIRPIKETILLSITDHAHHVLIRFDRFDQSTSAEKRVTPSLVDSLPQRVQVPAEQLSNVHDQLVEVTSATS
jgi:hypothetical protein